MLKYNPSLKNTARTLRKNMTDAERKLWKHLRRDQVLNLRFYRQKIIGSYIVDFYCPGIKLVIEVDGDRHFIGEAPEYDKKRSEYLRKHGLKIYRVTSIDVYKNIEGVMRSIYQLAEGLLRKTENPPEK